MNKVPPSNENPSNEDNISIKRDDSDENQIEPNQIDNVERGNGPPSRDHVDTNAERTYPKSDRTNANR